MELTVNFTNVNAPNKTRMATIAVPGFLIMPNSGFKFTYSKPTVKEMKYWMYLTTFVQKLSSAPSWKISCG